LIPDQDGHPGHAEALWLLATAPDRGSNRPFPPIVLLQPL
jgi:hypothetical protein